MANQGYCSDQSLWGKSQYISLKEIVEGYMDKLTPDDYTYDVERRLVLRQARRAVSKLNESSLRQYKYLEMELNKTLQVPVPVDYLDYYKISWIDENGITYPMVQNSRYNLGLAILQDHDYNFICDSDGQWITVDGTSPTFGDDDPEYGPVGYNTDRSQIFENGYFNVDKNRGIIQFSPDAKEKKVLLEYITDGTSGLKDSEIKIHKFAKDAIDNLIYFWLIERNRNVPDREKYRARKAYNIAKRKMRNNLNPVREEDILQLLRARSRWVKQV